MRTVEQALQRKREVANEIAAVQSKLREPHPTDERGFIIRNRQAFRQGLKERLVTLTTEARELKDWLRIHACNKPSEYEMLGRAYRLLLDGAISEPEVESLLSDIEMHVPHMYLFERGAA